MLTGLPAGDRDEWTDWDFWLVVAHQMREAYTDSHGLFREQTEDPAVFVDAIRKIDKFEQAKGQITGAKNYKAAHGEYFVPEVKTRRSNGEIQTFTEYIAAEKAKGPELVE